MGSYFGGAPLHNDIGANQLSLLTWQQQWLGGRLDSHLGRTNARRYFLIYNCETVVTCNDPIIDASTGILPPPYGAWGGYLKYRATPTLYLHAGAFESNPVDYLEEAPWPRFRHRRRQRHQPAAGDRRQARGKPRSLPLAL